ncbi:hypothetical protein BX616_003811 [Lobosporangium transversale]|nr:hypothetical protein BX616_003811 [Lobosporangium transversale]
MFVPSLSEKYLQDGHKLSQQAIPLAARSFARELRPQTACFLSQSKYIQDIVQCHYRDNGPAEAIGLWQKQMIRPYHRESTARAGVDYALEHIKGEMERASQDKALHFPANSITQERIGGFELEFVNTAYTNSSYSKDSSIAVPMIAIRAQVCRSPISPSSEASEDALRYARAKTKDGPFLIVYDNINMTHRKYNQRLDNQGSFESGTTATLIGTSVATEEERHTESAHCLQLEHLMPTLANEKHLRETMRSHLVSVLRRNYELQRGIDTCSIEVATSGQRNRGFPITVNAH